jgi:hypothetical protein
VRETMLHEKEREMTVVALGSPRSAGEEAVSLAERSAPVSAHIVERDGRCARVECDGEISDARIAFGCLVQPEPGDRVLISVADGIVWIVSVLERHSAAPPRLWAEGDIGIVSAFGNISLTAAEAVNVDAGVRARVAAPEIDLHAGIARFVLDELLQVGRRFNLYVAKIRSVGEMVETFAEHVLTRAQRGSRFIAESDRIEARDIDHRAESTLHLRAENAFITADNVARVDAEQIHMG